MHHRQHRYNTQYPIELRTATGPEKAQVVDVNNTGARIEGLCGARRGDKLQLNILSLRVDAVVQWVAGGRAGIVFRPQITNDQVDTLRYRRDGRKTDNRGVGFGFAEMR
ncbi:PilZ domain-containing protein [Yoonia sp.]|uniref:PilZ domain-containing protein n=1 Tax=Yoonia sp. TaxID=2212373 RepID=UPI0025EB034C|nr:PilZ domain-containing protein [Yoonia sp.]